MKIKDIDYSKNWWSRSGSQNRAKTTRHSNSSFWMDEDFLTRSDDSEKAVDVMKLAGYKRAIANFVRIVTKKDIPVNYSSGKDSYTDGKKVVISGKLNEGKFDCTVGLALHEGSHCLLTDFTALPKFRNTPKWGEFLSKHCHSVDFDHLKTIVNVIEDRRIDKYIYQSAPGYQGYYRALYDEYFNSKIIDEALTRKVKNKVQMEDYLFHIINFTNPNRTLDVLPGLRSIYNTMSIATIDRLKTTSDSIDLALEVLDIIAKNIAENKLNDKKSNDADSKKDGGEGTGSNSSNSVNEDESDNDGNDPNLDIPSGIEGEKDESDSNDSSGSEGSEDDIAAEDTSSENSSGSDSSGAEDEEEPFSERELKKLKSALEDQENFLNGDIKKGKLSKRDIANIDALSSSSVESKNIEFAPGSKVECFVVRGTDRSVIESDLFAGLYHQNYLKPRYANRRDVIQEGLALGTVLGKRLKTRDEDRSVKTSRSETGKIDRRLICELGFGNERVFEQTLHHTVTPSCIHISIDASGSMSGSKFESAVKTAVAIAKATSMISSVRCIISLRSTCNVHSQGHRPIIWIAYDSAKDSLKKLIPVFYGFYCGGATPEGLCFQSILKDIAESSRGKDSYFINVSDGEPCYSDYGRGINYSGTTAFDHTRKQVEAMMKNNIRVLSYFVSNTIVDEKIQRNFEYMYPKVASFINVEDLTQLSTSINALLQRK